MTCRCSRGTLWTQASPEPSPHVHAHAALGDRADPSGHRDFSTAVPIMRETRRTSAAFIVAPLRIDGATGCNVNPLMLL